MHAIKDGQASIDFAKPVRDARMQPVGFDGSGAHAAELLQCDNHSILNESKSSRELTLYVLLAVLATIAVAAVVAMGWAIKTGHLSLDKFMSVVFSEPVCIGEWGSERGDGPFHSAWMASLGRALFPL